MEPPDRTGSRWFGSSAPPRAETGHQQFTRPGADVRPVGGWELGLDRVEPFDAPDLVAPLPRGPVVKRHRTSTGGRGDSGTSRQGNGTCRVGRVFEAHAGVLFQYAMPP